MKKRFLSVILALCIFAAPVKILLKSAEAAEEFTEGGYTYTILPWGNARVTGCDDSITGDIEIPSTLGGYVVERIENGAFENNTRITSVTIPDSVIKICDNAFSGCTSLMEITIPDSVIDIGMDAFSYCESLSEITIPDSVYELGGSAFSNCKNLNKIKLSKNLDIIEGGLFSSCENLTEVTIPESVTSIGDAAFYNCTSLTEITIPDSVTKIGAEAFSHCDSLKEITIPISVTNIGSNAFVWSRALESITLPATLSTIGQEGLGLDERVLKTINYIGSEKRWKRIEFEIYYPYNYDVEVNFFPTPEEKEYEWMYNYSVSDNEATITWFDPSVSGSVEIPQTLGGYKVTGISADAFYKCNLITSVSFPDSLTSIGSSAFSGCTLLEEISLPYSITSIGSSAFSDCTLLEEISLPDSITSIASSAFDNTAFYNDSENWENGVLYIGTNLIGADNDYAGEYEIKPGTKCIAKYAFEDCVSLTGIVVPDSVEFIGDSAFDNCQALENVSLPDTIVRIGTGAFEKTAYYQNENNWENGALYAGSNLIRGDDSIYNEGCAIKPGTKCIADSAFEYCNFESITIPESVEYIGESAFLANYYLTEIAVPKNVTEIKEWTFSGCENLKAVNIPWKTESIGDYAFYYCYSLSDIYYTGSNDQWNDVSIGSNNYLYGAKVHPGSSGANENFTEGMYTYTTLPAGGVKIIDCDDSATGDIDIPSTLGGYDVVRIGLEAFKDNTNITGVTIPNTVQRIDPLAFYSCRGLRSVTIPDSVTDIDNSAFSYCESLTEITIPDSVIDLGDAVFEGCKNLSRVKLPQNLTSIADMLFSGCESLTEVNIPESVTVIDGGAFNKCVSLTDITIPNSVTTIGEGAFSHCESLTEIIIPDSVTSIGGSAFEGCISLTQIIIPDGVESMGESAFQSCKALETVTIPLSLTNISGYGLFAGDRALKTINYTGSQKRWNRIKRAVGEIYDAEVKFFPTDEEEEYEWMYDYKISDGEAVITGFDTSVKGRIEIPQTLGGYAVISIDNNAFFNCNLITFISFPDGLKSIGALALENCNNITGIALPVSVKTIYPPAFVRCSITDIYYAGTEDIWQKLIRGNDSFYGANVHYESGAPSQGVYSQKIEECSYDNGVLNVKAVINSDSENVIGAFVYAAVYDANGKLLRVLMKRADINGGENSIDFTIDGYTYNSGDYVKVFLTESGIYPMCESNTFILNDTI